MTKIHINPILLAYRREMVQLVHQIVKENVMANAGSSGQEDSPRVSASLTLLPPPRIERLDLYFYEGQAENLIWIHTSGEFGILNVHLTFSDEHGNLIERGDAIPWPDEPNRWAYVTTASVLPGTSVTVQAAALDPLGGMGARSECVTASHRIWHPA